MKSKNKKKSGKKNKKNIHYLKTKRKFFDNICHHHQNIVVNLF